MRNLQEFCRSATFRKHVYVTIVASLLAGCGASDDRSAEMDLVVTQNVAAVIHWIGPGGRTEIPTDIEANTIVLGKKSDLTNGGTCTVRWTDMEKREALGGGDPREVYLDLPCDSLAIATDADRSRRIPYHRIVPAAYGLGNDYRGQNDYLETESIIKKKHGDNITLSLTSPVWACKTENDYYQKLGLEDTPCIVILGDTILDMVDPHADTQSNFYRIRISTNGITETYLINKGDATFIPHFPSLETRPKRCMTTPKAKCVGG